MNENAKTDEMTYKAYEAYISARNEYYTLETAEQNKLDSYAKTFSMALIAASFGYFAYVSASGRIYYIGALYWIWGLSFLSLASVYFSSFFSAKAANEAQKGLEKYYRDNHNVYEFYCGRYAKCTQFFNGASLFCFVVALLVLFFFIYENPLGNSSVNCPCVTEIKK